MHKPGTLHVSNLLHNFNHTCMLRDLLTSTQEFLKFTITQLARLWYYYLHISKQSSSIKLLLVFNTLIWKFYYSWIPSILGLFKKITMLFKTFKIIQVKHERSIVSIKQIHHRALKDISEALEQKLYSSKDISEAHRVF